MKAGCSTSDYRAVAAAPSQPSGGPKSRTDTDCTLWYCPTCKASGVITMDGRDDRGLYGVVRAIKEAHAGDSPDCAADQRVVGPGNWFRDSAALDAPTQLTGHVTDGPSQPSGYGHAQGCDCTRCDREHRRITGHAVWCDMIHDGNRQCSCAEEIE
jgi:hypothetical protein